MSTPVVREVTRKYAQLPRFFRWFSEHCVLRQMDSSDAARIWKAVNHPASVASWTMSLPRSEAEVADLVQAAQIDWMRATAYSMAILRKTSHEFIGWIELRAAAPRGAWVLDWFIHPAAINDAVASQAIGAAVDLMFTALDAQTLYANCAPGRKLTEKWLNDVGFIELLPAGSLDPRTGKPRARGLFELGRRDWTMIRQVAESEGPPSLFNVAPPKLELALL